MPFYLFLSLQQSHLSSRLRSSSMTDGVSDPVQPPTPTVHLLFSSSPLLHSACGVLFTHSQVLYHFSLFRRRIKSYKLPNTFRSSPDFKMFLLSVMNILAASGSAMNVTIGIFSNTLYNALKST